jgi:hypothetical protein
MGNQPGNQPADQSVAARHCRTANALIKDQVTPMLFRKHIVSTRTLLQLAVATVFFVGGVGAAFAANSGIAPVLVPYTITTIAGTPQYPTGLTSVQAGFAGEGQLATPTLAKPTGQGVLDAPFAQAVDSVGNVYITDTSNDIIREVNAQTGLITTIAGVIPKGCSGATCTQRTSGCADGVLAAGNPIGQNVQGIAVDAYGNIYFDDSTTATASIIYRGGVQVANFITLVNPAGVANSGGKVLPGYVYHIAGTMSISGSLSAPSACTGTLGNYDGPTPVPGLTSVGAPAWENLANPGTIEGAQMHGPSFITLDSAGNIYIADTSNFTMRVINTQATPQTFFQYTVPPGYMKAITNCSALLTTPCPTATTTATANTGINGPVNAIVYNTQSRGGEVDAWGNIYQLDGTGSGTGPPGIYSATAYAGGGPLTNLLQAEAPLLASSFGPSATPPNAPPELSNCPSPSSCTGLPTYGNSYVTIGNTALTSTLPGNFTDVLAVTNEDLDIRPSSLLPDAFGTFWFNDNHYPELERIDQYTGLSTDIIGSQSMRATASVGNLGAAVANGLNNPALLSNYNSPATFTNPWSCVYGVSGNVWTQGPVSYDPQGDGCPAIVAQYSGGVHPTVSDGLGNIYLGDGGQQLVRELPIGNVFPATPVNTTTPVIQAIQVHFSASNAPKLNGSVPDVATGYLADAGAFTITSPDFTINTSTPEFPMGALSSSAKSYANNATTSGFQMWPPSGTTGYPTCTQLGVFPIATSVKDYDCLVYVQFNPSAPGARQAQLKVTTANGVYNFPLYGVGTGGQLAVDGGKAVAVSGVTGLGTTAGIALSPNTTPATMYIADPNNNRVVTCTLGSANSCAFQGTIGTGLSGPMGVATDTAGNVYISDTGNNRILKVTTDGVQSVLGNNLWIPGSLCDSGSTTSPCPTVGLANEPGAFVTKTTPPPQYTFKAPQGLAVDVWGNVYVADTGNSAVVEIPSNPALGGAVPLQAYSGAPQFKNPVAIAVDSLGNIYVADTKNAAGQIVKLPPGGGDLVTVPGTIFANQIGVVSQPNGVAVDAAGDVYVSSAGQNAVFEVPSNSGPGSAQFALNFPSVSAPAGLALDPHGNLYVADSGNQRVMFDNRVGATTIDFGLVPQDQLVPVQPICSGTTISDGFNIGNTSACVLTVTNIGTTPVTFGPSVLSGQQTPFTVTNSTCDPVGTSGPTALLPGLTCTLTATFTPTADILSTDTVNVNVAAGSGNSPALTLSANGEPPQVKIVLTDSFTGGTSTTSPTNGATATITATVTQPNTPPGGIPTGTVTFTYVVDQANKNVNNCGTSGVSAPIPLNGAGVATFTLPAAMATGVTYDVAANYNGDANDSATLYTGFPTITTPGVTGVVATVSSTQAQLTYIYGSPAPVPVGTVTVNGGALPAGITAKFGSNASATSTVASYPVVVSFTGTGACSYGFPSSVLASGGSANVIENPATLTYTIPNFSAQFGAPNIGFGVSATVTGQQNGDGFGATFAIASGATPPVISTTSSTEPVGSYTVTPTVVGLTVADYVFPNGKSVATNPAPSSSLTVTKAGTAISASLTPQTVLNTAAGVGTVSLSISVATTVPEGIGTPGGTVAVTDVFTPITATGLGTPVAPVTTTIPLAFGAATYPVAGTPISTTPGLHQYSFSYSGDQNFVAATLANPVTLAPCTPSSPAPYCLVVDYPDFTLTSTTGPVVVIPGVVPSGNGLLPAPNQSSAAPETAVLFVNQILGFTGSVALTCAPQAPPNGDQPYVSCFMTPPNVCFAATSSALCTNTSKTAATVVAIDTPATLPLGFKTSELRTSAARTVLAFLPLGVLAFCVRRRRRLSKALWTLMIVCAIGAGMTGCGGNQVDFYTPIPTGPQTVTVNATWGGSSTQPAGTRSFVVPIAID